MFLMVDCTRSSAGCPGCKYLRCQYCLARLSRRSGAAHRDICSPGCTASGCCGLSTGVASRLTTEATMPPAQGVASSSAASAASSSSRSIAVSEASPSSSTRSTVIPPRRNSSRGRRSRRCCC